MVTEVILRTDHNLCHNVMMYAFCSCSSNETSQGISMLSWMKIAKSIPKLSSMLLFLSRRKLRVLLKQCHNIFFIKTIIFSFSHEYVHISGILNQFKCTDTPPREIILIHKYLPLFSSFLKEGHS